jgi:hypothetical protein
MRLELNGLIINIYTYLECNYLIEMAFIETLPSREGMRRLRKENKEKNPRPRGRPIGWRKNKGETEPRTTIQVYHSFKDSIDFSRQKGENTADTVQRMFTELQTENIELGNKIKELESRI